MCDVLGVVCQRRGCCWCGRKSVLSLQVTYTQNSTSFPFFLTACGYACFQNKVGVVGMAYVNSVCSGLLNEHLSCGENLPVEGLHWFDFLSSPMYCLKYWFLCSCWCTITWWMCLCHVTIFGNVRVLLVEAFLCGLRATYWQQTSNASWCVCMT